MNKLRQRGVEFIDYHRDDLPEDEKGVMRGPDVAWFKDPAGNVLSVLQERS